MTFVAIYSRDEIYQVTLDPELVRAYFTRDIQTGERTISIEYPVTEPDAPFIKSGNIAILQSRSGRYEAYDIITVRSGETKRVAGCEHRYYELATEPLLTGDLSEASVESAIGAVLSGAGNRWQVGDIDPEIDQVEDLVAVNVNPLEALRDIERVYDCELDFRTEISEAGDMEFYIDAHKRIGAHRGYRVEAGHNLESVESTEAAEELVTALYGFNRNFYANIYRDGHEFIFMVEGIFEGAGNVAKEVEHVEIEVTRTEAENLPLRTIRTAEPLLIDDLSEITVEVSEMDFDEDEQVGVMVGLSISKEADDPLVWASEKTAYGGVLKEDQPNWDFENFRVTLNVGDQKGLYYVRAHVRPIFPQWGTPDDGTSTVKITTIKGDTGFIDLNFNAVDEPDSPTGQLYVEDETAREMFGKSDGAGGRRHVFGVYESTAQTPERLYTETKAQLQQRNRLSEAIDARVAILAQDGEIAIGDRVDAIIDDTTAYEVRLVRISGQWDRPLSWNVELGDYVKRFSHG